MDIITTKKPLSSISCDLLGIAIAQTACDEDSLSQTLSGLGDFGKSLAKMAAMDEFKGKLGSKTSYATFGHIEATRIVLLGAGDGDIDGIRRASGTLGSLARVHGAQTVCLSAGDSMAIDANAAREGFGAGNYQFDKYKSEDKRKSPAELLLLHNVDDLRDVDHAHAIAAGQSLARDLVNEPAAVVYPQSMADIALGLANDNLTVEVWNEDRIADAGMGGIIGVGQGSAKPARFIHMTYKPEGQPRKRLALVGKGVTFDSGGLSLKPAAGMLTMRCDMAGAAAVIGAMRAIRDIEPDVEVHGIVGAVENMNDGNSYKVGDILKMYNGKTVEVHNTDAEGRLVLADCLALRRDLGWAVWSWAWVCGPRRFTRPFLLGFLWYSLGIP